MTSLDDSTREPVGGAETFDASVCLIQKHIPKYSKLLGKVVILKSYHANPSTILLYMVTINLIIPEKMIKCEIFPNIL